jgi:hypothetical protein
MNPHKMEAGTLADRRRSSNFHVVMNAANIKQAGKIKVRIIVEGEEVRLGTLAVNYQEPPPSQTPAAPQLKN